MRPLPSVLRTRHLAQSPSAPPSHRRDGVLVPRLLLRAQRLFSVELLEEAFAKLVGADHDGTGGSSLDDPWEKACKGSGG